METNTRLMLGSFELMNSNLHTTTQHPICLCNLIFFLLNFLIEEKKHIRDIILCTPSKLSVTYLLWEKFAQANNYKDWYGNIVCIQERQLLFHTQIDHWYFMAMSKGDNYYSTRNADPLKLNIEKIQKTTKRNYSAWKMRLFIHLRLYAFVLLSLVYRLVCFLSIFSFFSFGLFVLESFRFILSFRVSLIRSLLPLNICICVSVWVRICVVLIFFLLN